MNLAMKKPLSLVLAGVVITGILTGCGSQSTSATPTSTAASTSSDQNQSGQHQGGQHRNGQGMIQALENAGASASDAQTLATLIRTNHTDPKWVISQLKNKESVANITSDIKDGKAPKMQWNGNHKANSNSQDNSANNANASGSSTTTTSGSNTDSSASNSSSSNSN